MIILLVKVMCSLCELLLSEVEVPSHASGSLTEKITEAEQTMALTRTSGNNQTPVAVAVPATQPLSQNRKDLLAKEIPPARSLADFIVRETLKAR